LKCLPDPFCAEFLVEIRLPHSNVKYLWHGMQECHSDPYHSDTILDDEKGNVCFEFNLTTDISDNGGGFFSMKECGIFPIYSSALLPSILNSIYLSEDEVK
jgi:hypothetical protein